MNLIYSCVFFQESYIHLLSLLLKSYILFGIVNSNTKYLVITNPSFEQKIRNIYDELNIDCEIWCLELNTIFQAGYSRLKIFEYNEIYKYNKILYLDCDILVTNKLSNILDFDIENKLYVLREGLTNDIYHGIEFFQNENPNIPAFTSGILLFNNCSIIKNLFNKILEHIYNHEKNNYIIPCCLDQPFIVYHTITDNLYNNEKLVDIVINNPEKFNGETISHFCGVPGWYDSKIKKMTNYMNDIMFNYNSIKPINNDSYLETLKKYSYLFDKLNEICIATNEPVEGNCFTQHLNINNKIPELIYKQMNHFSLGKISKNIMEIGFNAGHSSLLYLLSNENSKITIFDICEHKYTLSCFKFLNEQFPNRIIIYPGDSTQTVPKFIENNPSEKFDLIHINGCHITDVAEQDFMNSFKLASNIIIWDDTQIMPLNSLFNKYNDMGLIQEIFLHKTQVYEHRIAKINKLYKKEYSWENSLILFGKNNQMSAFGMGEFNYVDKNLVRAKFGGRIHLLKFNNDYSKFISVREGDFEIVKGKLIFNYLLLLNFI